MVCRLTPGQVPDPVKIRPAKLLLDKSLASLLLLVTAPLSLAIVAAIVIDNLFRPDDRGPLFYREIRISQGRPFPLYKFRIFKTEAITKIRAGAITKVIENDPATCAPGQCMTLNTTRDRLYRTCSV